MCWKDTGQLFLVLCDRAAGKNVHNDHFCHKVISGVHSYHRQALLTSSQHVAWQERRQSSHISPTAYLGTHSVDVKLLVDALLPFLQLLASVLFSLFCVLVFFLHQQKHFFRSFVMNLLCGRGHGKLLRCQALQIQQQVVERLHLQLPWLMPEAAW